MTSRNPPQVPSWLWESRPVDPGSPFRPWASAELCLPSLVICVKCRSACSRLSMSRALGASTPHVAERVGSCPSGWLGA